MARYLYDVFITHTYEDHGEFVNELIVGLTKRGLSVWCRSTELKSGVTLFASISEGLRKSSYGIVILSSVYLTKKQTMKELDVLLENKKLQNRILFILFRLSVKLLKKKKSPLVDIYTASSHRGVNRVIEKILQKIEKVRESDLRQSQKGEGTRKRGSNKRNVQAQNVGVIVLGGRTQTDS